VIDALDINASSQREKPPGTVIAPPARRPRAT
jgi:hypothetical protein